MFCCFAADPNKANRLQAQGMTSMGPQNLPIFRGFKVSKAGF